MNTTEMAQLHLNAQRNLMSQIRANQELPAETETLISALLMMHLQLMAAEVTSAKLANVQVIKDLLTGKMTLGEAEVE